MKARRIRHLVFGAEPVRNGTCFRVWAPDVRRIEVLVTTAAGHTLLAPLGSDDGMFSGWVAGVHAGDRYQFRVNGEHSFPDPASRYQPEGVHGPSEIVDPRSFHWDDERWSGIPIEEMVIYELHIGTFTPEGTFAAAKERLPYLRDLGINAIELMPVADFPGERNWGYDGVSLFAPARCYGRPDDLRQFVNDAHRHGLAVILDVVYNHLGPDGNYLGVYSKSFVTDRHHTAWGAAHNFDGLHSETVREFFIDNALHWVRDYHIDGLRLDATHAILDDSPRHFLEELAGRVRAVDPSRKIVVIAEDHRNLAHMVSSPQAGGWGLDAVWADGFHHQTRRLLAGDCEGYYSDYTGTTGDLAVTMQRGWYYCGQVSNHLGEPLGTDPTELDFHRFVYCLQNHDQVGNRAFGERLHHQVEPAAFRAATALCLCGPATPLLFMGQEWGANTPFLYFTDHNAELGRLVTAGRRHEFRHFTAFADPQSRDSIPDPQADATFAASKLRWEELSLARHSSMHRLHRDLLKLRRTDPALQSTPRKRFKVRALNEETIALARFAVPRPILLVVRLKGKGAVSLDDFLAECGLDTEWEVILTTEEPDYSLDPAPPEVYASEGHLKIQFAGPAAIILRGRE